jgi:hypothetical protein
VEKKGVMHGLMVCQDSQWIERVSRCGSGVGLFLCDRAGRATRGGKKEFMREM